MSEEKFVVGSEPGLFPPMTVTVIDKEYEVHMRYPELKRILELEDSVVAGSIKGLATMYEEAHMMTGCPKEILETIDVREIRALIIYVAKKIFLAEQNTPVKEKNGSEPGEKK